MKNSGGDRRRDAAETTDEDDYDVLRTSMWRSDSHAGERSANQQDALRGIVQN